MVKKVLRTMFLVAAATLMTVSVSAQEQGDKSVGGNVIYGLGDYSIIGINFEAKYTVLDNVRVEPSISYFLPKDDVTFWGVDVDATYLFALNDNFYVFPLAGLGLFGANYGGDYGYSSRDGGSSMVFALNVGAGAEYFLNDTWSIGFKAKYKMVSGDAESFPELSLGVAYKF